MQEPKLDPTKMWFRVTLIVPIVVATAFVVALYMDIRSEIAQKHVDATILIEKVIAKQELKAERDDRNNRDLVAAVERVRDEIRIHGDGWRSLSERWIELFRTANAVKMPDLVVPDLPK